MIRILERWRLALLAAAGAATTLLPGCGSAPTTPVGPPVAAPSAPVPVVPNTALFEEAGQSYVFTVEGGKLAKHAVKLGARDDVSGLTEVRSGLSPGADVVRVRMGSLKAGAPALVRTSAAASAPSNIPVGAASSAAKSI